MAFDQTTRNRLQRFVNSAREILSDEFTRQLQAVYGMDPKQGTVADISSLTHLNNSQRQTAHILRETLEHYLATTPGKSDKDRVKQVLSRIVREQAFTVLNRLAALRMAEARDFLLESVGKGQSSKGFQLYRQLAGTSHGETGDAYRNYLFSLFDEFSIDLAVLFDRYSTQGRLFPRESALLELLAEINHHEIEALWAEDETIGWIYQYFNSQEERKKMRAESQAPRNSRELAVRNQFFTPRYVVEFLTDNTLGRIWYEMTQGNTALIDSCSYLVRRPTEVFLKSGEQSPETDSVEGESLSQDELLKQPVYIPYRKLKDPRSIRMLDPACGSMHFGLYAFDLYEQIYLEAWQLEQELGPDAFQREANQQALQTSFANLDEFKAQIPKLIIENNIHGVDIDPRAVQIAGLSLWQRAQRAWQQQGVKPQQRPVIVKSNIVCAEPMPGDKDLLKEFTGKLHPPALGQLVEVIFDKMELAGEAGTLLKIEEEIQTAIDEARAQWETKKGSDSIGDLFQDELEAATPQRELGFDLYGIDNETFWDDAEQLILKALSDYADRAEFDTDQKRLFAEDAAKGFAFIDLCRKRFDVSLMNPPFGESTTNTSLYLEKAYPDWSKNILCAFISRLSFMLSKGGLVAAVIDRSPLNKSSYEKFRNKLLIESNALEMVCDLGWDVLDANVEVSSLILSEPKYATESTVFINLREIPLDEKSTQLIKIIRNKKFITHKTNVFSSFPNSALVYDLPIDLLNTFHDHKSFSEVSLVGFTGHQLQSERHFRVFWEMPLDEKIGSSHDFCYLYNGGQYSRYTNPKREVALFGKYKALGSENFPSYSYRIQNKSQHFKKGVCFGKRGEYLDAHLMNENTIFTVEGQCIPIESKEKSLLVLAVLNSTFASRILNTYAGQHKYSGYINLMPAPDIDSSSLKLKERIVKKVEQIISLKEKYFLWDETTLLFESIFLTNHIGLSNQISSFIDMLDSDSKLVINIHDEIDTLVNVLYEIKGIESLADLKNYSTKTPQEKILRWSDINNSDISKLLILDLVLYLLGACLGRWELDEVNDNALGIVDDTILFNYMQSDPLGFDSAEIAELLSKFINNKGVKLFIDQKNGLFDFHLDRYSVSGRNAPIYWPLQTPSGSYTLWVYYHRLNEQTLYTCINDFVEPKLAIAIADLNSLRNKSARSTEEEKELAQLTDLEAELKDFRDELLRLAKFWKPNLNDGVQITAAPLWKLFQHKAWQKKLKETWSKLEDGDYDWAYLAGSIWPERVLRKCHQDRSLAIAHDVEDIFWHEVEIPIMRGKKPTGNTKTEWQPKNLTDTELTALIKQTVIGSK